MSLPQGAGHQNFGVMTSMRYRVYKLPEVVLVNMTFDGLTAAGPGGSSDPELTVRVLDVYQRLFLDKGTRNLMIYPNFAMNTTTGAYSTYIFAVYQQSGPKARCEGPESSTVSTCVHYSSQIRIRLLDLM